MGTLQILQTPAEVIDALGGRAEVAALLGLKSRHPIDNWVGKTRGKFPRWTAYTMLTALNVKSFTAPLSLWNLPEHPHSAFEAQRNKTGACSENTTDIPDESRDR